VSGYDFEYAQARLQARYGARPDEAAWYRLASLRGLPAALACCRESAFRGWLEGSEAVGGVHALEGGLRRRWRMLVAEVAHWLPEEWRRATGWCALLPDLPVLDHLAEGGEALPWIRAEPALAAYCGDGAPAAVSPGLTFSRQPGQAPDEAWLAEWRRRLPPMDEEDAALFAALEAALREHLAAFRAAAPAEAWPLRRRLQARLDVLFRRCLLSPAAAFVFLLQALLDLERLRAALVPRAVFFLEEQAA
jgi:hypothetical protein